MRPPRHGVRAAFLVVGLGAFLASSCKFHGDRGRPGQDGGPGARELEVRTDTDTIRRGYARDRNKWATWWSHTWRR